jgi:hypothetical protein
VCLEYHSTDGLEILKWLKAGFSPWSFGFNSRLLHMKFIDLTLALKQVFLQVPLVFPAEQHFTEVCDRPE